MGVVSPIGIGLESFWESIEKKKSGVRVREELVDFDSPLKLYSPVVDFDGKQWVRPRKSLKVMCRPIQYGFSAATMAIEQAGLDDAEVNPDRLGTVFGSETFFADPQEVASVFRKCVYDQNYVHDRWGEFAMREIQPLWMLKYLPNMVTSHISIVADARGPSNSICQGEASGILAIIEGADLIRRGVCDSVIVGGTGSQTTLSGMLYRGHHTMSQRTNEPEKACRPFDRDRDGTVFGEGAGALVIESENHARTRGATPLAEIQGWSRGFHNPTSKVGFDETLEYLLRDLTFSEDFDCERLSHINAHGLACIKTDIDESNAIQKVFGEIPVTAIKSYFGHLGPGSSVIELIASLIGLSQGKIPATLNCENPDSNCPINIAQSMSENQGSDVVKTSFSNSGQVACLRMRTYK